MSSASEKAPPLVGRLLDVLINNAGIGHDASLSMAERARRTLEVNVVGVVRLTEAMTPLLANSKRARIVRPN